MTLTKLDTLLKNETIDLTKIKRIVVENQGKAPYYNELIHTNAFSVDATAKAIRTMELNKDTNAYEATDIIVAVVNADKTVSILGTKSKDVYSAMRQPKVLTVNEGADTGRALLMGFREFLVGNYDGLFGGIVVDLDITQDGTTPVTPTFTITPSQVSGKVGDVVDVVVSGVTPSNYKTAVMGPGKNGNIIPADPAFSTDTNTWHIKLEKAGTDTLDIVLQDDNGKTVATRTVTATITAE